MIYKIKAPRDIDIVEMKVPSHFPNKIPDRSNNGDPKPKRTIQIIENMKNKNKLNIIFFPKFVSIFS